MIKNNNLNLKIKITKTRVIVFLNNLVFFQQDYLKSNHKKISNKMYTFYYVLFTLNRFGFVNLNNNNNKLI